jgi:hypothetical protein
MLGVKFQKEFLIITISFGIVANVIKSIGQELITEKS